MSIANDVSASNSEDHNYPYQQYIKSPSELGASSAGNLTALGNDVTSLIDYTNVLISGHSNAQKVSGPLGNKYFLDTGAQCNAPDGSSQERYIFINNQPNGSIPLMSSGNINMTNFQGLVPGVLEDVSYINPIKLFTAFTKGKDCQLVTMETRDISNVTGKESRYILNDDISDYSACWFPDKKNPVTGGQCVETMQVPDDPMVSVYILCISLLGMYIIHGILRKGSRF